MITIQKNSWYPSFRVAPNDIANYESLMKSKKHQTYLSKMIVRLESGSLSASDEIEFICTAFYFDNTDEFQIVTTV
jgi:hypothetical protein